MSSKFLHRLAAIDTETRDLLAELQRTFIRIKTPIGAAISPVVSAWHQDKDGSIVVQFSPLAADLLPDLSGVALLRAARALAQAPDQPSGQDAA